MQKIRLVADGPATRESQTTPATPDPTSSALKRKRLSGIGKETKQQSSLEYFLVKKTDRKIVRQCGMQRMLRKQFKRVSHITSQM